MKDNVVIAVILALMILIGIVLTMCPIPTPRTPEAYTPDRTEVEDYLKNTEMKCFKGPGRDSVICERVKK